MEAIAAVARLKHVYVLDIHGLTCLFQFPEFKNVFELLAHFHIFAINMGEDEGRFDESHFGLLASKICDGSSAVRRWFVESNPTRRAIPVECGLVKDKAKPDKLNVFTIAKCNWGLACAARGVMPGAPRLLELATIAAHSQTKTRDMGVLNT